MPSEDHKEVAAEGQDRPGPYTVRKGHFVLIDNDTGPVVPSPHRLAWKRLTGERIVFLVRDPRDICVSGAYHWRVSVEEFLERMIKGDVARCGRWDRYVDKWIYGKEVTTFRFVHTVYEVLLKDTKFELWSMLKWIVIDRYQYKDRLEDAIERQSFQSRKAQIHLSHFDRTPESVKKVEQELRRNNIRKGIVGDWRNHFTKEMNDRIWSEFGWMMERLGYTKE